MKLFSIKLLAILTLIISIIIFYFTIGIALNSAVDLKYNAVSENDIKYIRNCSYILLIYLLLVIITTVVLMRGKSK